MERNTENILVSHFLHLILLYETLYFTFQIFKEDRIKDELKQISSNIILNKNDGDDASPKYLVK